MIALGLLVYATHRVYLLNGEPYRFRKKHEAELGYRKSSKAH